MACVGWGGSRGRMGGEVAGVDTGRVPGAVEQQVSVWASNERGGRGGSEQTGARLRSRGGSRADE
jgi:hypothetical protein